MKLERAGVHVAPSGWHRLDQSLFLGGALGFLSTVKAISACFPPDLSKLPALLWWGCGGIVVLCVVIFLTSSDFMLEVFYCLYNLL